MGIFRAAAAFGEWRRYQVVDEQGRSRLISEYDLRQRADAIGRQMTAQVKFNLPAETRAQMRQEAVAQEIGRFGGVIKKIRVAHRADLGAIELRLQQAISDLTGAPALLPLSCALFFSSSISAQT